MDPKVLLDDSHSGVIRGVAPFTYGQGDRPPRGDDARARADYTCDQLWSTYTEVLRRLSSRCWPSEGFR